jgi:quercetin dioxygenase-like cupin family protein
MEYRDLLPSRLGGKLIASHIRLSRGGDVPDYIHYHKVLFQLIYCLSGRIKVVYEDQGPPFWLAAGDCVLQPPEIRHRVLEAEAGSEVLEISSPAEHETWVEHEMSLPTADKKPDRFFDGHRFVRSIASEVTWQPGEVNGVVERVLGIYDATNGLADVRVRRMENPDVVVPFSPRPGMTGLGFVVAGRRKTNGGPHPAEGTRDTKRAPTATEILRLEFKDSAFDR